MGRVYRRPAARCDLIAHYRYLAENAGEVVADRFLRQAEVSFDDLLKQRRIGSLLTLRHSELGWDVKVARQ